VQTGPTQRPAADRSYPPSDIHLILLHLLLNFRCSVHFVLVCKDILFYGVLNLYLCTCAGQCPGDSSAIQFIADNLQIDHEVLANYNVSDKDAAPLGHVILRNAATSGSILNGKWEIYFTSLRAYTLRDSSQFQVGLCIVING
jgi:hypothetical protein